MAFTYDPTLASAKDRLRRQLGDTDVNDIMLQDEEIQATLDRFGGDETLALSDLARMAISSQARRPTRLTAAEGDTIEYGNRLRALQGLIPTDSPINERRRRRRTRLPYRGDE